MSFLVYNDPNLPKGKALLGFKGSDALDTGFFYAPYVPLLKTPIIGGGMGWPSRIIEPDEVTHAIIQGVAALVLPKLTRLYCYRWSDESGFVIELRESREEVGTSGVAVYASPGGIAVCRMSNGSSSQRLFPYEDPRLLDLLWPYIKKQLRDHRSKGPLDPKSFNPSKGILTRYGKKLLAQGQKHYQKLTIK